MKMFLRISAALLLLAVCQCHGSCLMWWSHGDHIRIRHSDAPVRDVISVSVGSGGIFYIDTNWTTYYKWDSIKHKFNPFHFIKYSDDPQLRQLDVGNNSVWAVSVRGYVFYLTEKQTWGGWAPQHLKRVDCLKASYVTVSDKDHAWVTTSSGKVYRRVGTSIENPKGSKWRHVAGASLTQLSAGLSGLWGVNAEGQVYYREGSFGDPADDQAEAKWVKVDGPPFRYISSGGNVVVGVDAGGNVHYREGITSDVPTGTWWDQKCSDVNLTMVEAFTREIMWAIDQNQKAWFLLN